MKLTQDNCYKLALEITGCNGMEWPFFSSKILEFNNLELLHALVTCATPSQHLALWHHEKRSQEFIFKVSMIESILSVCDGYLIKSPETEYLDASEKVLPPTIWDYFYKAFQHERISDRLFFEHNTF